MTNITKYLLLLEELKAHNSQGLNSGTRWEDILKSNVEIFNKYIKLDKLTVLEKLVDKLNVPNELIADINLEDDKKYYVCCMEYVLLELIHNLNFNSDAKEDLVSVKHTNLCIEFLGTLSGLSLRYYLHKLFSQNVFYLNMHDSCQEVNYNFLLINIEFYSHALKVPQLKVGECMDIVARDFVAAVFTLLSASFYKEVSYDEQIYIKLKDHLNFVWLNGRKTDYFRTVMVLNGSPGLEASLRKYLQKELFHKLGSKDGFAALVATLYIKDFPAEDDKHICDVLAQIVACKDHSAKFQNTMIRQIWHYLKICIHGEVISAALGAGLLCLRRLYDLNEVNQNYIKELIAYDLMNLVKPPDLLTGVIIMENKHFNLMIEKLFQMFCTSSVESLPSDLLIKYLPLLVDLYYNIPNAFNLKQKVGTCVVKCLHNRSDEQLTKMIRCLYLKNDEMDWFYLHHRVMILPNEMQTEITVKVGSIEHKGETSLSTALSELLMGKSYNLLTYRVFMNLLNLMLETFEVTDANAFDKGLFQNDEELVDFLNTKYPIKVDIILSLNTLISHEPLRFQLSQHPKEFLDILRTTLEKLITNLEANRDLEDQTLTILLAIIEEVLENSQMTAEYQILIPKLKSVQKLLPNELVNERITSIIELFEGASNRSSKVNVKDFNIARSFIESKESHLQVYGIQLFLALIKKKDSYTISNTHRVLALALKTLKNEESYTFLNCVRLFVGMVYVLEAEVLEQLSQEYLNENAKLDYRLVVGEAIIKVSQEIGPLLYKYKDTLLNCYMNGCRSPLDEFRLSAYCNLGQLCKTLSYEVHSYFHELLNLIDCELSTKQYLPTKRAAVMILSELLEGMPRLVDFAEILRPIYQLLKIIESSQKCDEIMRVHAGKGLDILSAKIKDFLFPEIKMEKEIRVLNLKDAERAKKKKHILEILDLEDDF